MVSERRGRIARTTKAYSPDQTRASCQHASIHKKWALIRVNTSLRGKLPGRKCSAIKTKRVTVMAEDGEDEEARVYTYYKVNNCACID